MKVLEGVKVVDTDGAEVVLSELWSERAVVLVFVRHFG
jgi:hypothetical protein